MSYSQFSFRDAKKQFHLVENNYRLFPAAKPIPISNWLRQTLENMRGHIPLRTEKARSEGIVAPLLLEAKMLNEDKVNLFSGERLDVNSELGLVGECDFILSASPASTTLDTPILCVVEAKQNIIENSLGQCVAQMVGALMFNQREDNEINVMFGCVTTGELWQFLRLEGQVLSLDTSQYFIASPEKIIGVFQEIIDFYPALVPA